MVPEIELQYFFDPLCGWCYASAPALQGLAASFPGQLRLMPSGLFFGARPVSSIAEHAWHNDQRIQALTGQRFSQAYHRNVLLAPDGVFTSAPATRALQALGEIDARLEPEFLHAVQLARYVDARDTARDEEVAEVAVRVAANHGVALTAEALTHRLRADDALRERTEARLTDSQTRMARLGIRGVPQLVVVVGGKPTALNGEVLYRGPDGLRAALDELLPLS
ncbi:DsbA family protein [Paracoccus aminophilus]|uniref:Protein-disulfide isomerase n=1 Tax=Paracoccus aminophilus JCM 7686 TaxID=1367847 RepID=S5XNB9_PARAH|nr:DsbA family protein [Paracoccus aminophilus]AGT08814.1 protein-disulfide isomerase [Paracoccus aminophilus JCM 7686]